MRTAGEMYQYCLDNGFGQGQNQKWGLKHFSLIEESLASDEEPTICFIGLHNYVSTTKHDSNYAYAVTNKRIIMAQKQMFGENIQSVSLSNINDVTLKNGMMVGVITIDTMKEKFNVALNSASAKALSGALHDVLMSMKSTPADSGNASSGGADELIKLKQLVDMGIITQEDFDAKKRQILGI